jgi:hypothetical protein
MQQHDQQGQAGSQQQQQGAGTGPVVSAGGGGGDAGSPSAIRVFCAMVDSKGEPIDDGNACVVPVDYGPARAGVQSHLNILQAAVGRALRLDTRGFKLSLLHPKNPLLKIPITSDAIAEKVYHNDIILAMLVGQKQQKSSSSAKVARRESAGGSNSPEMRPIIIVADVRLTGYSANERGGAQNGGAYGADPQQQQTLSAAEIISALTTRVQARQSGDFKTADSIRKRLVDRGIHVADRAGHITAAAPSKQAAYDVALAAARATNPPPLVQDGAGGGGGGGGSGGDGGGGGSGGGGGGGGGGGASNPPMLIHGGNSGNKAGRQGRFNSGNKGNRNNFNRRRNN